MKDSKGSSKINLTRTRARTRKLLAIINEFNEGCRSAIGDGQAPDQEARLMRRATQGYW